MVHRGNAGLQHSLVLVSCVKSKLSRPAPARELYTSRWFCKARDLIESSDARWFILSARYGLIAPEVEIAPYDLTLNSLRVADRRAWATGVLQQLLPETLTEKRVVILAGRRYYEFIIEPLKKMGLTVELPMQHLGLGEQLSWLSKQ